MTTDYKVGDLWSGLAFAALGAYIIAQARGWGYAGPEGPGPGFFPLWYGLAMVALSGALVLSSVLRKGAHEGAIAWRKVGRALGTWLAIALSVAACGYIGLLSSLALLTFFIVAVIYRRPLRVAATVGLFLAAGFYVVFPLALGVSLPLGLFGF
jgi:putative tricarboxylic transport membrane protein